MNAANDFFFGSNGKQITPTLPVIITTRDQGLRTAAWLEFMSQVLPDEVEGEHPTYEEVCQAILAD